jgi:hypothetical protein
MRVSRLLVLAGVLALVILLRASAQDRMPAAGTRVSPLPADVASVTSGNVEHGRYIVERVAMCFECHSPRDEKGNLLQGQEFMGGAIPFQPPWTNDWAIRAPRIRGLPGYTEELGVRLLTQGAIDRQGIQLRLPMPRFRMTPQDASDVVAFLKSMP